jgi:GntR family transcriptional regulator
MTGHAPVYLQIRAALTAAILDGRHSDGDPLPSVRALASRHQANPLTVAKAYQVLQEEGVVVVRRGVGMFVAPGARRRLRTAERRIFLEERWPAILCDIRRLDLDPAELLETH